MRAADGEVRQAHLTFAILSTKKSINSMREDYQISSIMQKSLPRPYGFGDSSSLQE